MRRLRSLSTLLRKYEGVQIAIDGGLGIVRLEYRNYTLQEKDFGVGRQSLADKRREMVPALRDLYLESYI